MSYTKCHAVFVDRLAADDRLLDELQDEFLHIYCHLLKCKFRKLCNAIYKNQNAGIRLQHVTFHNINMIIWLLFMVRVSYKGTIQCLIRKYWTGYRHKTKNMMT